MASDEDECRQLLVHPAAWDALVDWFDSRGIGITDLGKFFEDDLPTYIMTPHSLRPAPSTSQQGDGQ